VAPGQPTLPAGAANQATATAQFQAQHPRAFGSSLTATGQIQPPVMTNNPSPNLPTNSTPFFNPNQGKFNQNMPPATNQP
jgi:hypothetical protein